MAKTKVATFISDVEGWLVCDADGENVYRTTEWPIMSDLTVNTNQEAFDAVVRHFIKQKHQSGGGGSALYRSANGQRCAIGALLHDNSYRPALEYFDIQLLVERGDITIGRIDINLLSALQHAHDVVASKYVGVGSMYKYALLNPRMLAQLEIIATTYSLDPDVLFDEYLEAYVNS